MFIIRMYAFCIYKLGIIIFAEVDSKAEPVEATSSTTIGVLAIAVTSGTMLLIVVIDVLTLGSHVAVCQRNLNCHR